MGKTDDNEMIVDVTEFITKRRKGYKFNLVVGIIFVWFIPIGPMLLIQSIRFLKKTDQEMVDVTKKYHDKIAKRKGKTVKYINEPA